MNIYIWEISLNKHKHEFIGELPCKCYSVVFTEIVERVMWTHIFRKYCLKNISRLFLQESFHANDNVHYQPPREE